MYYPQYNAYMPYQNISPAVPQNSMIWVSGELEAANYPVAPNAAVTLWEQSGKAVYLKSADATGKPTLKVYDLIERVEKPEIKQDDNSTVKTAINEFSEKLDAITAEIELIKNDLYGLAGKKKKRVESDDE